MAVRPGRCVDATAPQAIAGRRLRWLDGATPVGTGATLHLATLQPGTHRLVLGATDHFGCSGRAALTVKVTKALGR